MNNNGTGLVLASTALSAYPRVMLPLIVYNLAQHVVAGVISARMVGAHERPPVDAGGGQGREHRGD
jgi:BASS family bile acid:Na+ symporter